MNPGAQNGIVGDYSSVDLPEVTPDDSFLNEEKKKAKYSRSAEFKQIKEYCEAKIGFYQTYLPNGAEVGLEVAPTTEDWRVANRLIAEFKGLMNIYQTAADAVKDASEGSK